MISADAICRAQRPDRARQRPAGTCHQNAVGGRPMTKETVTRIVCFCSLLGIATASQAQMPKPLLKYFRQTPPPPPKPPRSAILTPEQYDYPFEGKLNITRVKTFDEV